MAIPKNSPVIKPSNARGTNTQDRLSKLLPPTDKQIQDDLDFWLIIVNSFEGEF